jgi:hypothetical protein
MGASFSKNDRTSPFDQEVLDEIDGLCIEVEKIKVKVSKIAFELSVFTNHIARENKIKEIMRKD